MLGLLFGALIASASPAFETPLELPIIAQRADSVVRGEVLLTHTEPRDTGLVTVATVRVSETLRGPDRPVVSVELAGGSLPGGELLVFGQARLIQGHEVLLFLNGDQIVGLGQGAFVVDAEQIWRGNRPWVLPHPDDLNAKSGDAPYYTAHALEEVRSIVR